MRTSGWSPRWRRRLCAEEKQFAGKDSAMQRIAAGFGKRGVFLIASVFIQAVAAWMMPVVKADDASSTGNKKIDDLVALGHKFLGSSSCKSCHGEAAADPGQPPKMNSEFTVWSTADKHHESFTTLSSDKSKAIATKGGYGDPASSAKCLSCHSLNVPAASQGGDFKLAEGNSCEACHGPAEAWSGSDGSPHKTKG